MAEATRASLATESPDQEPDAECDEKSRKCEERNHSATCAAIAVRRRPRERRLLRRALEIELVVSRPRRRAILELGQAPTAAARERRQLGELEELGELRLLDRVGPHRGARPGLVVADHAAKARIGEEIHAQHALLATDARGLAVRKEWPRRGERHAQRAGGEVRRAGGDLEGRDLPLARDVRLRPLDESRAGGVPMGL